MSKYVELPIEITKVFGEVEDILGEGSWGQVILTTKGWAIKKMKNKIGEPNASVFGEISVYSLTSDSPHVLKLEQPIIAPDYTYFIMEAVSGDLGAWAANQEILGPPRHIFYSMCKSVEDLHRRGIGHMDIKPSNFLYLLREDQKIELYITDFGCAIVPLTYQLESPYLPCVTANYRPPEVFKQEPLSAKVDIWSLGIILAELELSVGNTEHQHLQDINMENESDFYDNLRQWFDTEPTSPRYLIERLRKAGLNDHALQLINKMLQWQPSERPTIYEVLADPYFRSKKNEEGRDPNEEDSKQEDVKQDWGLEAVVDRSRINKRQWQDPNQRRLLVEDLIQFCRDQNYTALTLERTVSIMDQLIYTHPDYEQYITSYIVPALYIAMKQYELEPPSYRSLYELYYKEPFPFRENPTEPIQTLLWYIDYQISLTLKSHLTAIPLSREEIETLVLNP